MKRCSNLCSRGSSHDNTTPPLPRTPHDPTWRKTRIHRSVVDPRRHAPSTTPALVHGRASINEPITVRAATSGAVTSAQFVYDAPKNALRWSVAITGDVNNVAAVVLRRTNAEAIQIAPANGKRVILRLLGPGMRSAHGEFPLSAAEREALQNGKLSLAVYGRSGAPTERTIPAQR